MFQLWFGGFSREGGKGGGSSLAEEKISSTLTDLYFRPFQVRLHLYFIHYTLRATKNVFRGW